VQRVHRRAIALLVTVMFVMLITVAIGIGLKQVNEASDLVQKENFLYQSSIIVEDILSILQNSPDIKQVAENNSSEEFYIFVSQAAFIPFEIDGLEILMKIKSARSKFCISSFNAARVDAMKRYLDNYQINNQYVDILVDNMSKIKEDNSYNSNIFDAKPYLFRDYLASEKHLREINNYYMQEYNDDALKKIDFEQLLYYSDDANMSIDLNFATPEVWELMLGTTRDRAEFLAEGGGSYTALADLNLDADEKERLAKFKTSFFEPIIFVELEITQNGADSKITFEYDIREKKGRNFTYDI